MRSIFDDLTKQVAKFDWPNWSDADFARHEKEWQAALQRGWKALGTFEFEGKTTESDKGLTLELDVPGYPKEALTIEVQGTSLDIYAAPTTTRKGFSRLYTIPTKYDSARMTASVKDGVLTIFLPCKEVAKADKRKVEIS